VRSVHKLSEYIGPPEATSFRRLKNFHNLIYKQNDFNKLHKETIKQVSSIIPLKDQAQKAEQILLRNFKYLSNVSTMHLDFSLGKKTENIHDIKVFKPIFQNLNLRSLTIHSYLAITTE